MEKLKVAVYYRMTTKYEKQAFNFNVQKQHYIELIQKNPEWEFEGMYYDYGLSNLRTEEREGLNEIVEKALNKKIDFIITKSISKVSKNILYTLDIIKKLKQNNVNIYFEKENINTKDENSDMMINFVASIIQEEIKDISENIKWGYKKRFEKGEVLKKYKNFMGYTCINNELVIVPEQAEVVKKIFDLYLSGMTLEQIKNYLEENNIKTVTQKDTWYVSTIDRMLSNEKYTGDSFLQKTFSDSCITRKRIKNTGQKIKYYVPDSHPAIISKDIFESVQKEKAKRERIIRNYDGTISFSKTKYNGKYLLGNLLICGICNVGYRRRIERDKIVWRCKTRVESGKSKCNDSPTISEEWIKEVLNKNICGGMGYEERIVRTDVKCIKVFSDYIEIVKKDDDTVIKVKV